MTAYLYATEINDAYFLSIGSAIFRPVKITISDEKLLYFSYFCSDIDGGYLFQPPYHAQYLCFRAK